MTASAETWTTTALREVEVVAAAGLHARPAAEFAEAAGRFAARVTVRKGAHEADATSVLLLLTLDVRQGDRVVIYAHGPEARAAVDALAELLEEQ